MPEPLISAVLIVRNEACQLEGCFEALGFADEIVVVVDSESRDASESIARARATRVILRRFDDFATQRNAAIDAARGHWIFSIDADERVTPELSRELRQIAESAPASPIAFRVPIRSIILGRQFRGSGTQQDRPIRFFRNGSGRWTGEVHEVVAVRGEVGETRGVLLHRTLEDMSVFVSKLNRYTDLEALKLANQGVRPRPLDYAWLPAWTFLKLYVGKRGIIDGAEGFLFCALSGVSAGVRQWKLREILRRLEACTPSDLGLAAAHPVGGVR